MFFGIVYFGYLARAVGSEGVAVVSILSTLYGLFPLILLLATPTALQRFIAESMGRGDASTAGALVRTGLRLSVILGGLGLAAGLLVTPFLSSYLFSGGEVFSLQLLAIAVATFIVNSLLTSIFFGFQLYQVYGLFSFLGATWGQAVSVFLLLAGYGIRAFIMLWIVENIVVIVALRATLPKVPARSPTPYPMLPLVTLGIPLFASTFVPYFVSNVFIKLYIFETLSRADLGVYEVASRIIAFPKMYETMFLSALFPYLSRAFGIGGNAALGRGVGWSARLVTLVFAPILVGLALVARPLLLVVFGGEFAGSVPLFLMLLFFAMLNFLASPFTLGLQALGRTRDIFVIQAAASWTCLGTTILLSRFGIMGVALGGEALGLVASLLSVYAFRERVGAPMDLKVGLMAKILLAALAMVPPVYGLSLVLPRYRFVPLQVLVGVATYLLAVRWLRLLSREDVSTMSMMFPPWFGGFLLRIFGYE